MKRLAPPPAGLPDLSLQQVAAAWPVVVILYFLAWKYLVGFLNELLGIYA